MNKIKLTNYQNVAYWWTKALKKSVIEFKNREELTEREEEFLSVFAELEVQEWRWLYNELSLEIQRYLTGVNNKFFQCTDAGCHNKMNRCVSRVVGVDIPDVSLSSQPSSIVVRDGIVIESYEDDYKVLKTEYNENYLLTGNEELITSHKSVLV